MKHESRYETELFIMILVLLLVAAICGFVVGHSSIEINDCNYDITSQ